MTPTSLFPKKKRQNECRPILAALLSCTHCSALPLVLCSVLGKEPTFDTPLANATAEVGTTALLPCAIDYLGKYKVITWLNELFYCRTIIFLNRCNIQGIGLSTCAVFYTICEVLIYRYSDVIKPRISTVSACHGTWSPWGDMGWRWYYSTIKCSHSVNNSCDRHVGWILNYSSVTS